MRLSQRSLVRKNKTTVSLLPLTLFRMGVFGAAHVWGGGEGGRAKRFPLPKICHTYPTMMRLSIIIPYLKKIQRIYNHMTRPLISADISIFFHCKSVTFVISRNADVDCILIHNF